MLNPNLSPTIHGSMAWTLLLGFVAFTLVFVWMLAVRYRIEVLSERARGRRARHRAARAVGRRATGPESPGEAGCRRMASTPAPEHRRQRAVSYIDAGYAIALGVLGRLRRPSCGGAGGASSGWRPRAQGPLRTVTRADRPSPRPATPADGGTEPARRSGSCRAPGRRRTHRGATPSARRRLVGGRCRARRRLRLPARGGPGQLAQLLRDRRPGPRAARRRSGRTDLPARGPRRPRHGAPHRRRRRLRRRRHGAQRRRGQHTGTRRSCSSPTSRWSWWGTSSGSTFVSDQIIVDHTRPVRRRSIPNRVEGSQRDRPGERRPRAHAASCSGWRPSVVGAAGASPSAWPGSARPARARPGRSTPGSSPRVRSSPRWPWSARSSPTTSRSPSWPPTTAGRRRCSTRSPGMWSALAGSILLWGLILSGYIVAMVWRFRRQAADPARGVGHARDLVVAAFFFALMAGPADPFKHRDRRQCPATASAPTCCCRTTRSWPSTRRCCTWASSGSRSPSPSPSPRS